MANYANLPPPGGRKEPLLEYWEILPDGRYQGQVFGRPGYEDGDVITTGTVVKVSQTHITTASGTTYKLGRPNSRRRAANGKDGRIAPTEKKDPDARPLPPPPDKDDEKPFSPGGRAPLAGRRSSGDPPPPRNGLAARAGAKPRVGEEPARLAAPARRKDDPRLEATNRDCKRAMYVGDHVRVLGVGGHSGMSGEVLYIGPAAFANGRQVCGVKLDKPQPGSVHDGKEHGERYFRCSPGHGCYVLLQDVELLPRDESDDDGDADGPFDLEQAIRDLVGLPSAKQYLRSLRNRLEVGRKRAAFGVKDSKPLHTLLVGSMGMDFPGLAGVLAGIFQDARLLPKRTVHVVGRKDLVAGNTEGTAKLCDEAMTKAKGGVMLIGDAAALACDPRSKDKEDFYGSMALARLLAAVDKSDGDPSAVPFVLVLAVRRDGLGALMQASPALAALSLPQIELVEYSVQETVQLLRQAIHEAKFELAPQLTDSRLADLLGPHLARCAADKRGMELVRRLTEEAIGRQTDRVFGLKTISKESLLQLREVDFEDSPNQSVTPTEQVLARLNTVVGLAGVKNHIQALIAQLQLEQERRQAGLPGMGSRSTNLHMIFSGNPGTGKTTVARIIAEVLQSMGILRCGHCVETDRADLVAGYVGQTALKVHEVVQRALGGVLFVDEAYALVKDDKDQFGREALDTLIKLVEDYRDDLVVILAGYPREMDEMIGHNPGVRSRFPTVILFEDYSVDELMQIADMLLAKSHMDLGPGAREALRALCGKIALSKDADNGNGRAVRNVVERALRSQALRLVQLRRTEEATGSTQELCTLTKEDFDFPP